MRTEKLMLRYWNANGFAVGIVAVVNTYRDEIFDWAAYIGGTTQIYHENDCLEWVAANGCKLSYSDAEHFCSFPMEKYRP